MNPSTDGGSLSARILRRLEWSYAIGATAVFVGLHATFLLSAGALWRDEVHSVNVATLPSLPEIWSHMPFDSFPVLWFMVLRGWIELSSATFDAGIRVLGVLIGIGIGAALWRNARVLGHGIPLVSLALLGFNSAVISFGDSIRGHGLGMLTGLLAFGLIWQATNAPSWRRTFVATLAALVAVHSLYYNAVFVFAACVAGAAVTMSRRSWRLAGRILAIGVVCALSFIPYTLLLRKAREWDEVIRVPVNLAWIWFKLREAFATSGPASLWLWVGAMALAVALAVCAWLPANRARFSDRERSAALFSSVAMTTGTVTYILFLERLSYVTQPWYYVGLMALVAATLDAPFSVVASGPGLRSVRLVFLVAVTALALPHAWTTVRTRKTNMDLVASRLNALAVKGDLIVVNPWYLGISYKRYSRANADWETIPPVASHTFHREDLLKQKLMSKHAVASVLERMTLALQSGHRIFWIGDLFIPDDGETPTDPPPAPNPVSGWSDGPYYEAWGLQAGYLIKTHARAAERLEVPVNQAVNPYEDASLFVFSGWWEETSATAR